MVRSDEKASASAGSIGDRIRGVALDADPVDAMVLLLSGVLHLLFGRCLLFSPSICRFQGKALPGEAT